MEVKIKNFLLNMELGKLQSHQKMGVIPLTTAESNGPEYVTLKQALEKNFLTIKEISESGSVPELKVINNAEIPVLLLDGEELSGAKQNRVLNTSILLKKKSETVIPVSCTEQGRWSYVSDRFDDSNVVMSPRIRRKKARSVSASLRESQEYRSDQSEVWEDIDQMTAEAEVESATGAMKDVFEERRKDLDRYMKAFQYTPGQKGILVFLDGEAAGFDMVSRDSAYKELHSKLVKSYAMEAVLLKNGKEVKNGMKKAKDFINQVTGCEGKKYESAGSGWDHRFEGDEIVGSALVYGRNVIHAAFFKMTEEEKAGSMSSLGRRKRFRTG
ncbi:MAG: DUF6569 family protein [Candidatus Aminicenantes bacterium]